MPNVRFKSVLASSPSLPSFGPENLISENFVPWKGLAGSDSNFVSLKLERPAVLKSIDLGNYFAHSISILVANSCDDSSVFKVLLDSEVFMFPNEARRCIPEHGTRTKICNDFNSGVKDQMWDIVKIVCKQPFNKQMPYGLSFVRICAVGDKDGENGENLRDDVVRTETEKRRNSNKEPVTATFIDAVQTMATESALKESEQRMKDELIIESRRLKRIEQIEKARDARLAKRCRTDFDDDSDDEDRILTNYHANKENRRDEENAQRTKHKTDDVPVATSSPLILNAKGEPVRNRVPDKHSSSSTALTPRRNDLMISQSTSNTPHASQCGQIRTMKKMDSPSILTDMDKVTQSSSPCTSLHRKIMDVDLDDRQDVSSQGNVSSSNRNRKLNISYSGAVSDSDDDISSPSTSYSRHRQSQPGATKHFSESSSTPSRLRSPVASPRQLGSLLDSSQKPHSRAMEGVIFSMSGFVQPERGEIVNKMIEMGAVYQNDLSSSSTHLISKFHRTPKINEVRSKFRHVQVVSSQWVLRSSAEGRRLREVLFAI